MTYKIIKAYDDDKLVTKTLDSHDMFIIPIVNPDGKSKVIVLEQ